jgi:hypothetical protein
MIRNHIVRSSGAVLLASSVALAAAPQAVATAALPKVTVRIEGKSKTLLAATTVQTKSGSISKGGAPSGACPASSGPGALAVATHGRWSGRWSSKHSDYVVKTILGETSPGWELFANDVAVKTSLCATELRTGDQLLFADVPAGGPAEPPLGIVAPATAAAGQQFEVKVVYYTVKGKAEPLAGATLTVAGHAFPTDANGNVPLKSDNPGKFTLAVAKTGYIRGGRSGHVGGRHHRHPRFRLREHGSQAAAAGPGVRDGAAAAPALIRGRHASRR